MSRLSGVRKTGLSGVTHALLGFPRMLKMCLCCVLVRSLVDDDLFSAAPVFKSDCFGHWNACLLLASIYYMQTRFCPSAQDLIHLVLQSPDSLNIYSLNIENYN